MLPLKSVQISRRIFSNCCSCIHSWKRLKKTLTAVFRGREFTDCQDGLISLWSDGGWMWRWDINLCYLDNRVNSFQFCYLLTPFHSSYMTLLLGMTFWQHSGDWNGRNLHTIIWPNIFKASNSTHSCPHTVIHSAPWPGKGSYITKNLSAIYSEVMVRSWQCVQMVWSGHRWVITAWISFKFEDRPTAIMLADL